MLVEAAMILYLHWLMELLSFERKGRDKKQVSVYPVVCQTTNLFLAPSLRIWSFFS